MKIGNPNNKAAWLNLKFPIMIAPMEYISSTKMLNAIASVNGIGFVQRHNEINDKFAQAEGLNGRSGFAINIDQAKDLFLKEIQGTEPDDVDVIDNVFEPIEESE